MSGLTTQRAHLRQRTPQLQCASAANPKNQILQTPTSKNGATGQKISQQFKNDFMYSYCQKFGLNTVTLGVDSDCITFFVARAAFEKICILKRGI